MTTLQMMPAVPLVDGGDSINAGLVAAWGIGEGGGTIISDWSGRKNAGAIQSFANSMWTPSRFGRSLTFAGGGQSITVPNASAFNGLANYSHFAWIKTTSAALQLIAEQNDLVGGTSWGLYINGGVFHAYSSIAGSQDDSAGSGLADGNWHFVGFTRNANAQQRMLYIDGVAAATTVDTQGGVCSPATTTFIGIRNGGGFPFTGSIALMRFQSRALTGAEVRRLYAEPFAGILGPRRRVFATIGGTTFFQTCLATNTPLSSVRRADAKTLLASDAPSAGILRAVALIRAATDQPLSFLTRQAGKPISRTNTPPATLARANSKSILASDQAQATLSRGTGKAILATDTPAALLSRAAGKKAIGTNTPSATLGRAVGKGIVAVSTPTAAVVRAVARTLAAIASPAAIVVRLTSRTAAVSPAPVASMARARGVLLAASNTPLAGLARTVGKVLGSVNVAAPLVSLVTHLIGPLITAPASVIRRVIAPAASRIVSAARDDRTARVPPASRTTKAPPE